MKNFNYKRKAHRHRAYKQARKFLQKVIDEYPNYPYHGGLCLALSYVGAPYGWEGIYPEIDAIKKRMNPQTMYWWPTDLQGYKARVKALDKCIKLTAPKKRIP